MIDDTELIKLTNTVLNYIRPNSGDKESYQDCWQTAYLSGLQALRNAQKNKAEPSRKYLKLAMQTAVYRLLHHKAPDTYETPPDSIDTTNYYQRVEARDFFNSYLQELTETQLRTLNAFYSGKTPKEIAHIENIKPNAVHARIKTAIKKVQSLIATNEDLQDYR